eukprot:scaffold115999_cov40-Cyclotella_meneghiniana.AAC.2
MNTMTKWRELDEPQKGSCQPCCSVTHGAISIVASIAASLAWILPAVGHMNRNSCHFLQLVST